MPITRRLPIPLIFTFCGCNNGLNAGGQSAIVVTRLETGSDLFINNAFAECVRQNTLQSITGLEEHPVVLNKNEKYGTIIFIFLTDLPGTKYAHGVIIHRRIRLHLREYGDDDLFRSLALEVFERLVQLRSRRRGNNIGVIVEIVCRHRRNDFIREHPETQHQKQNGAKTFHKSGIGRCRLANIKLHLGRRLGPRGGGKIRFVMKIKHPGIQNRRK